MEADLWYSRSLAVAAQKTGDLRARLQIWQEAFQAATRATRSAEDRHNACYHLATLYGQFNNHREAERYLRVSAGIAPNWFKPHWMLARVLAAEGRADQARVEAAIAVDRDGGKHAEVTQTLKEIQR